MSFWQNHDSLQTSSIIFLCVCDHVRSFSNFRCILQECKVILQKNIFCYLISVFDDRVNTAQPGRWTDKRIDFNYVYSDYMHKLYNPKGITMIFALWFMPLSFFHYPFYFHFTSVGSRKKWTINLLFQPIQSSLFILSTQIHTEFILFIIHWNSTTYH